MKKIIIVMLILASFTSCNNKDNGNKVDIEQRQKQQENQKVMRDKVGDPDIKNYEEAKTYKEILEDRDNPKLICHWYTYNDMNGKLIYQGRCKGYGIPYSTQFSNPERPIDYEDELGEDLYEEPVGNLPQAEPNGLFMPTSSSATWVLAIKDDNTISVEYVEPTIVVSKTKKPKRLCEEWSLPDNY